MFFTGVLYLVFEESLSRHSKNPSTAAATSVKNGSRVIMGMQVQPSYPSRNELNTEANTNCSSG